MYVHEPSIIEWIAYQQAYLQWSQVHRFQAVGLCGPCQSEVTVLPAVAEQSLLAVLYASTFHNKLIRRNDSKSLQFVTYKNLLGINSYTLASSLPNN